MALLIRFLILLLFILLVYKIVKYIINPKRKLELAHEQQRIYLLDDPKNTQKNLLLTYKGVMFEGKKFLGTTEKAFEVITILIWPHKAHKLQGVEREDFYFIEKELLVHYPDAEIEWKSPVKEFLNNI